MVKVRKAQLDDIEQFAPRVRRADCEDIRKALDMSPMKGLHYTLSMNVPKRCLAAVGSDGAVICMFGVYVGGVKQEGMVGVPWFVASDQLFVRENKIVFIRSCRQWVEQLARGFFELVNYTFHWDEDHLKWLAFMSYDVGEVQKHPVNPRYDCRRIVFCNPSKAKPAN